MSRLCAELDERVDTFLNRSLSGAWPYLWLDATYLKSRQDGPVQSKAAVVAVAVNAEGRRETLGMAVGPAETAAFWTDFLRSLVRRGLSGVRLVVSDAHEGLKQAVARVFGASWQRCRVHFLRNALAHVPRRQHQMVAAVIRTAFVQEDAAQADLKREVNLSLTLAYAGLHEGGTLTKGHDVLEGIRGAFCDGLAGPSAQVVLDFDLPFHNRAAQGRHLQARSLARHSTVYSLDLEREIRAQTGELIVSLDRAMLETSRRSEAVTEYDRLLSSTLERFTLGEATTSDIVLTEELKIAEEVSLVRARQRYAILLAQLRFTVGALLTYRLDAGRVVAEKLHPLGLDFPDEPVS